MAAQYTVVTLEEMDKFLRRGFRALSPERASSRGEIYYDLHLSENVVIRVWTSIAANKSTGADVGSDAIRIVLLSSKTDRPLVKGKAPIVKRTQNWKGSLQDRIEEYMEQYADREDYWESAASGEKKSAPDETNRDAPTEKQLDLIRKLLETAPEQFDWAPFGFRGKPEFEEAAKLPRSMATSLITQLSTLKLVKQNSATWARLPSGDWGIRGTALISGQTVQVLRKDGKSALVTVGQVLREYSDGTCLAEVRKSGYRYASEDTDDEPWGD